MPDGEFLFDLALLAAHPAPEDACAHPVGPRRSGRYRRTASRRSSPQLALLTQIRSDVRDLASEQRQRLCRLDCELAQRHRTMLRLDELVALVLGRLTAIERQLGLIEQPRAPRHSRHQPLGEDN